MLHKLKLLFPSEVEHAGHSHGDHHDGRLNNMNTQIAHKIAALLQIREQHPQAQFVLAGHSVGAYICLEVLILYCCNHDFT